MSKTGYSQWARLPTAGGLKTFATGYVGASILLVAATETTVPFDQIDLDDLGVLTAGGQVTITAASEGWWLLQAGVTFNDQGGTTAVRVYYPKIRYADGSGYITTGQVVHPRLFNASHDTDCQRVIGLFAGDVLDVVAYCSEVGNYVLGEWQRTYFQGLYLGGYTR